MVICYSSPSKLKWYLPTYQAVGYGRNKKNQSFISWHLCNINIYIIFLYIWIYFSISLMMTCSFLYILGWTGKNSIHLDVFDLPKWQFHILQINTHNTSLGIWLLQVLCMITPGTPGTNVQHLSFCVWLVSPGIKSSRLIFHCVYISHSDHPFICGWTFGLLSTHFLSVVNNAAIDIDVQIMVHIPIFNCICFLCMECYLFFFLQWEF